MLLFCTLFGLAAMHTLGHADMRMDAHPHVAAMPNAAVTVTAPDVIAGGIVQAAAVVAAPCTGDHCGGQRDHGGMTGWSICLAVLGGLAVVVLLAALLLQPARDRTRTGGKPVSDLPPARPPPRRRAGLTVASIAMLRI